MDAKGNPWKPFSDQVWYHENLIKLFRSLAWKSINSSLNHQLVIED
jgi:hypothetical protein